MRVIVCIRDAQINVDVGPGHQRLKWLAMVALQSALSAWGCVLGCLGCVVAVVEAQVEWLELAVAAQ